MMKRLAFWALAVVTVLYTAVGVAMVTPMVDDSFIEWLRNDIHPERAAVYIVCGVLGALGSYVKMWATKEIDCCLLDYVVHKNPRRTVLAMMAFGGTAITFILSGTLGDTPWGVIVTQGMTAGYMADSILNKAETA